MKYVITAHRTKVLPTKRGTTWTKVEVKTDKTGEEIIEVASSIQNRENLQVGQTVNGYIEKKPWTGNDGQVRYNQVLNGPTVAMIYEFLATKHPEIETFVPAAAPVQAQSNGWSQPQAAPAQPAQTEWNQNPPQKPAAPAASNGVAYPAEDINPEDIPF